MVSLENERGGGETSLHREEIAVLKQEHSLHPRSSRSGRPMTSSFAYVLGGTAMY